MTTKTKRTTKATATRSVAEQLGETILHAMERLHEHVRDCGTTHSAMTSAEAHRLVDLLLELAQLRTALLEGERA